MVKAAIIFGYFGEAARGAKGYFVTMLALKPGCCAGRLCWPGWWVGCYRIARVNQGGTNAKIVSTVSARPVGWRQNQEKRPIDAISRLGKQESSEGDHPCGALSLA
jgi:hypothetical protein